MKSSSEEKARLRTLLSNAISVLCKNSLGLIDLQFSVEALIGISVDNEDVMVVSFKETVLPDGAAVSYIWQKESDESKSEIVEEDAKVNSNALYSAEQFDAQSFLYEQQDAFEEVTNPTDTRIKIEKESMQYEEYSNNFTLSDAYDVNSSSPQVTNQPYSNAANKRRKQSAPIRVCNKQLDSEEADSLESKSCSIQQKLTVNQDYMNSSRFATNSKGSGQFFDSNLNGESRIFTEITKYSVPSKQSAYKSLSASRGLKRGMSRAEVSSYAGTSVGAHSVETPNDLSPNCSLSIAEHDLYSGQAENYTYQVLNTSHSAGANGKRRKPVSSSSAKNISEQDSLIISELLPYLHNQHRPMLIPPTVTQFAPKKRCRVCYSKKIRKEVRYCCFGCSDHPGLCLDPCFYQFHLVRGSAHPKPAECLAYSQEVPSDNDCPQNSEVYSNFNEASAEMT